MGTTIGLVHLDFRVPEAMSLKDKRRALKSFKDRLRNKHNVSVAEVNNQDNHRKAVLAIVMVGSERRYVESALQHIINAAETQRNMVLVDHDIQWV
ncbi:MAG: DUF503 domain-containing protein [Phycisphaerae bacterium]|nr:DUF503 domain-containing protein [Phycisphaerae bacterium]